MMWLWICLSVPPTISAAYLLFLVIGCGLYDHRARRR